MSGRNTALCPLVDGGRSLPQRLGYRPSPAQKENDIPMDHAVKIGRIVLGRKDISGLDLRTDCAHSWGMSHPERKAGKAAPRYAAIGARLRAVREAMGLTQEEMTDIIGVNQSLWSRYERGVAQITPTYAVPFANKLRNSLPYIYEGKLDGVHPQLLRQLKKYSPEVVSGSGPTGMDSDMGTVQPGRKRSSRRPPRPDFRMSDEDDLPE